MRTTACSAIALVCLASSSLISAQSSSLLEKRSEAAGFAGTLKFAIGRAARDCRDTLEKDDTYMRAIVNDWLSRNGRYSAAAELWVSVFVTAIARQEGREQGDKLMNHFMNEARTRGIETSGWMIGVSKDEKKAKCQKYEAMVHSGVYDITPAMPQYKNLVDLATYVEKNFNDDD